MDDSAGFKYSQLQISEIRLVVLQRESRNNTISIQFETHILSCAPPYEALSYCWKNGGDDPPVFHEDTGLHLEVNLWSALDRLVTQSRSRILWIDALCINQKDPLEKTRQVAIMRKIFQQAKMVLIWLGDEDCSTQKAFDMIHHIKSDVFSESSGVDWERVDEMEESVHIFTNLLQRPYFQRVWIIQEIAVSRNAMVICGSCTVTWEAFSTALVLYSLRHSTKAIGSTLRWIQCWQVRIFKGNWIALSDFLLHCRDSKATDPRDKVFAFLGLCKDESENSLSSDYNLSVAQTYTAAARFMISHEGNFQALAGVQKSNSSSEIPSWVPDWRLPSISKIIGHDTGNLGPWRRYHAALDTMPAVSDIGAPEKLLVKGLTVDVIQKTYDTQPIGDTLGDYETLILEEIPILLLSLKLQGIYLHTKEEYALACLLTLATDLMPDSSRLEDVFDKTSRYPHYILWEKDPENDRLRSGMIEEICCFIACSAVGRKFFVTEKGYIGLGPGDAKPGDIVSIFLGGEVPFIIRKKNGGEFCFVGESYVHGLMDGSVLQGRYEHKLKDILLV